jgi:hypothetical protein
MMNEVMNTVSPDFRRNVAMDLILTILLCLLWNIVVQYKQLHMLNVLLKTERFVAWKISVFTLLTCGIYFVYYEYQKAEALREITGKPDDSDGILAVVLSIIGLNFIWDAIFQTKINDYLDRQIEFRPGNPGSPPL